MSTHHIIVEDRRPGKPRAGDIISEAERLRLNGTAHRVYTTPVDLEILGMGAIAGFFRRDYGKGIPLPEVLPAPFCRLAMYSQARPFTVHWSARITMDEKMRREMRSGDGPAMYSGSIRLISDTSQGFPAGTVGATGDTTFNFSALTDDMHDGEGWVVGGSGRSRITGDGVFGWALHGTGRGFRVVWAAISQVG